MTPERRDELAELAWAFAKSFPTAAEQKREVATMLRTQSEYADLDAWALIVRGKSLARQKGERVS